MVSRSPAKVINPVRKLTNKKNKKINQPSPLQGKEGHRSSKLPALNNHQVVLPIEGHA